MKLKTAFLQMVYPADLKCHICDRELFGEMRFSLCAECMPKYKGKPCLKCGRSMSNDAEYCLDCQNYSQPFDRAYAPFVFENTAKKLIYKFKYGNAKYLAKDMAGVMYDCMVEHDYMPDIITFVPLHPKRRRERGYNQAEEVAIEIGRLAGVLVIDLLSRKTNTDNLAKMSAMDRREVVKDVFDFTAIEKIDGKNILLVDDVFTTGATAGACCEVLKNNGANRVEVLTFATGVIKPKLY